MNEDFSSRAWADNHHKLSTGIADALHAIRLALQKLNDVQYSAPWRAEAQKTKPARCR